MRHELDDLVCVGKRAPEKLRDKATREPTASGGGISHSTDLMFSYHSVALSGSHA